MYAALCICTVATNAERSHNPKSILDPRFAPLQLGRKVRVAINPRGRILEWDIIINNHGDRISAMPNNAVNGRNLKDGYIRGCGLQFGNLSKLCVADPLFAHAHGLIRDRAAITDNNLLNLFMLIKFYLSRLPPGHIAEFGSFRCGSAIFMAIVAQELCPGTKVFAFDSFAGMPDTDARRDAHKAGDFGNVDEEEIRLFAEKCGVRNLELVKGFFHESIPRAMPSIGPLRLSHIDCDLYDAVVTSYEGSKASMVPGGYIVFDDPLVSSCLGAFEAIEKLVIRRDGLYAEQVYPHLVYRTPA
jgi:hypothetical protein